MSNGTPATKRRDLARGSLGALIVLAVLVLPTVIIACQMWWVAAVFGGALWGVVLKGRLWRP